MANRSRRANISDGTQNGKPNKKRMLGMQIGGLDQQTQVFGDRIFTSNPSITAAQDPSRSRSSSSRTLRPPSGEDVVSGRVDADGHTVVPTADGREMVLKAPRGRAATINGPGGSGRYRSSSQAAAKDTYTTGSFHASPPRQGRDSSPDPSLSPSPDRSKGTGGLMSWLRKKGPGSPLPARADKRRKSRLAQASSSTGSMDSHVSLSTDSGQESRASPLTNPPNQATSPLANDAPTKGSTPVQQETVFAVLLKVQPVSGADARHIYVERGPNGVGFTMKGNRPVVIAAVQLDSPAAIAGLQSGDQLVEVDGIPCHLASHHDVASLLQAALERPRPRRRNMRRIPSTASEAMDGMTGQRRSSKTSMSSDNSGTGVVPTILEDAGALEEESMDVLQEDAAFDFDKTASAVDTEFEMADAQGGKEKRASWTKVLDDSMDLDTSEFGFESSTDFEIADEAEQESALSRSIRERAVAMGSAGETESSPAFSSSGIQVSAVDMPSNAAAEDADLMARVAEQNQRALQRRVQLLQRVGSLEDLADDTSADETAAQDLSAIQNLFAELEAKPPGSSSSQLGSESTTSNVSATSSIHPAADVDDATESTDTSNMSTEETEDGPTAQVVVLSAAPSFQNYMDQSRTVDYRGIKLRPLPSPHALPRRSSFRNPRRHLGKRRNVKFSSRLEEEIEPEEQTVLKPSQIRKLQMGLPIHDEIHSLQRETDKLKSETLKRQEEEREGSRASAGLEATRAALQPVATSSPVKNASSSTRLSSQPRAVSSAKSGSTFQAERDGTTAVEKRSGHRLVEAAPTSSQRNSSTAIANTTATAAAGLPSTAAYSESDGEDPQKRVPQPSQEASVLPSDPPAFKFSPYYAGARHVRRAPFKSADWSVEDPDYKPRAYTDPKVIRAFTSGADIHDSSNIRYFNSLDLELGIDRRSKLGQYDVIDGVPRNPTGRTGLRGRGSLLRWGPNHLRLFVFARVARRSDATPVFVDNRPILEVLLVRRGSGQFSLPDNGFNMERNMLKALNSEAVTQVSFLTRLWSDHRERILSDTASMLQQREKARHNTPLKLVFEGPVDDDRNTDNAWVEHTVHAAYADVHTVAFHLFPSNVSITLENAATKETEQIELEWVRLTDPRLQCQDAEYLDMFCQQVGGLVPSETPTLQSELQALTADDFLLSSYTKNLTSQEVHHLVDHFAAIACACPRPVPRASSRLHRRASAQHGDSVDIQQQSRASQMHRISRTEVMEELPTPTAANVAEGDTSPSRVVAAVNLSKAEDAEGSTSTETVAKPPRHVHFQEVAGSGSDSDQEDESYQQRAPQRRQSVSEMVRMLNRRRSSDEIVDHSDSEQTSASASSPSINRRRSSGLDGYGFDVDRLRSLAAAAADETETEPETEAEAEVSKRDHGDVTSEKGAVAPSNQTASVDASTKTEDSPAVAIRRQASGESEEQNQAAAIDVDKDQREEAEKPKTARSFSTHRTTLEASRQQGVSSSTREPSPRQQVHETKAETSKVQPEEDKVTQSADSSNAVPSKSRTALVIEALRKGGMADHDQQEDNMPSWRREVLMLKRMKSLEREQGSSASKAMETGHDVGDNAAEQAVSDTRHDRATNDDQPAPADHVFDEGEDEEDDDGVHRRPSVVPVFFGGVRRPSGSEQRSVRDRMLLFEREMRKSKQQRRRTSSDNAEAEDEQSSQPKTVLEIIREAEKRETLSSIEIQGFKRVEMEHGIKISVRPEYIANVGRALESPTSNEGPGKVPDQGQELGDASATAQQRRTASLSSRAFSTAAGAHQSRLRRSTFQQGDSK